jgi:hypothetical protein
MVMPMVGTVIGAAGVAAAASIALAGHAVATSPAAGTVSPFGGSVPVHVAHVGRIELDLEQPPAAGRLRKVPCPAGAATLACFVAPR